MSTLWNSFVPGATSSSFSQSLHPADHNQAWQNNYNSPFSAFVLCADRDMGGPVDYLPLPPPAWGEFGLDWVCSETQALEATNSIFGTTKFVEQWKEGQCPTKHSHSKSSLIFMRIYLRLYFGKGQQLSRSRISKTAFIPHPDSTKANRPTCAIELLCTLVFVSRMPIWFAPKPFCYRTEYQGQIDCFALPKLLQTPSF